MLLRSSTPSDSGSGVPNRWSVSCARALSPTFDQSLVNDDNRERLRGLNAVAEARGQTLAQMALSWVLRPGGVTSALIGVSSIEQLEENLKAADNTDFSDAELAEIDKLAGEPDGVNLWSVSSEA